VRAAMPTSAPSDVLLRLSLVCFNESGRPVDFLRNTPFIVGTVDGKTEKDALGVAVSRASREPLRLILLGRPCQVVAALFRVFWSHLIF